MKRELIGVFSALALTAGGAAFAQQQPEQMGQAQQQQQQAQQPGAQTLTGEVVRVERDTLYLRHMGAVIPFKLDRQTQYQAGLTQRELREGTQVRAQFMVERTTNRATSIAPAEQVPGRGGAGMEQPPTPPPTPEEPGTQQPGAPQGPTY